MTLRIRFLSSASEELSDAIGWYEERRLGLGRDFYRQVSDSLRLVALHPEAGSLVLVRPSCRRVLVGGFPYQLVYQVRSDEIIVVAVAHLKRRPGFWKHRG